MNHSIPIQPISTTEKAPGGQPPSDLIAAQLWFGQAISRPLAAELKTQASGILGESLHTEAETQLRGNALVSGFDRLALYNRQYWFRLINVMQVDYTCTIHVMGLQRYNLWVIRYLEMHPPESPYLNDLDHRFTPFMTAAYDAEDREVVLEALAYDRAFAKAFEGGEGQILAPGAIQAEDMLQVKLQLAPHVTALSLTHNWTEFRALVLDDESLEREVPLLEAMAFHRVIHRHDATLFEKEVEPAAAALLAALTEAGTLPEVFDRMPELSDQDSHQLEVHLSEWFSDFVSRGWVVAGV